MRCSPSFCVLIIGIALTMSILCTIMEEFSNWIEMLDGPCLCLPLRTRTTNFESLPSPSIKARKSSLGLILDVFFVGAFFGLGPIFADHSSA